MSPRPDLARLLADEIERRLPSLAEQDVANLRATLHALRGSTAMAGEIELGLLLTQIGRRARAGDPRAQADAVGVLARVLPRLRSGLRALDTTWPTPPAEFQSTPVSPDHLDDYLISMRERVGEIDAALASTRDPLAAVNAAYRAIHSMKSAAGSLGDDLTAWYCHGLESELGRARSSRQQAALGLSELARHRALLAALLEDPNRGLALLRRLASDSAPPPSNSVAPALPIPDFNVLRVPSEAIDSVLDNLEQLGLVRDEMLASAEVASRFANRMRTLRSNLQQALRLIGPPKPWGAPEAAIKLIDSTARGLAVSAAAAERGNVVVRRGAQQLQSTSNKSRSTLTSLGQTTTGWLFKRLADAARDVAEQELKQLSVAINGTDLPLDRRIAERLVEPLLQIVRNAVVHGIESPTERTDVGKPITGSLVLSASRRGTGLRISIQDDGRGVDLEELTARAPSSSPSDVLGLLFTPGFTTRRAADILAGRGVGLDLARETVRRLGGNVRLAQPDGGGLMATIVVPSETRVLDVLWVESAGQEFAVPVASTGRVSEPDSRPDPTPLAECLRAVRTAPTAALVLELVASNGTARVGLDRIGPVETINPRPLPRLIAEAGPYSSAVLRQDGSLRLVLDSDALVQIARTV